MCVCMGVMGCRGRKGSSLHISRGAQQIPIPLPSLFSRSSSSICQNLRICGSSPDPSTEQMLHKTFACDEDNEDEDCGLGKDEHLLSIS